jgi:hypothetical protein
MEVGRTLRLADCPNAIRQLLRTGARNTNADWPNENEQIRNQTVDERLMTIANLSTGYQSTPSTAGVTRYRLRYHGESGSTAKPRCD